VDATAPDVIDVLGQHATRCLSLAMWVITNLAGAVSYEYWVQAAPITPKDH
jgi:hypothetical protein